MAPLLQTPCRNQRQIIKENLFFLRLLLLGQKLTKPGQIQSKDLFFLEITMFLGQKIDKIGTDLKL